MKVSRRNMFSHKKQLNLISINKQIDSSKQDQEQEELQEQEISPAEIVGSNTQEEVSKETLSLNRRTFPNTLEDMSSKIDTSTGLSQRDIGNLESNVPTLSNAEKGSQKVTINDQKSSMWSRVRLRSPKSGRNSNKSANSLVIEEELEGQNGLIGSRETTSSTTTMESNVEIVQNSHSRAANAVAKALGGGYRHKRNISKDFSLPIFTTPPHESCSSLKDQFLRIKERFSGVSTTASKIDAQTSCVENPLAMELPPLLPIKTTASIPTIVPQSSSLLQPQLSVGGGFNLNVKLEEDLARLNNDARLLFSNDPWPVHMERWILEENCLRGYMTCWTIETGADLVSAVAKAVQRSPVRINPDISLQWIGRHLWGLTIQLPLTRSGEIRPDHLTLAGMIDKIIAEELDKKKIPPRHLSAYNISDTLTSEGLVEEDQTLYFNSSNQILSRTDQGDSTIDNPNVQTNRRVKNDFRCSISNEDMLEACDRDDVVEEETTTDSSGSGSVEIDRSGEEDEDSDSRPCSKIDSSAADGFCSVNTSLVGDEMEVDVLAAVGRSIFSSSASSTPLSWSMLSTPGTPEAMVEQSEDYFQRFAPEKTGWLKKRTGLNSWQPRWFELKGNRLYYFGTENDGIPRGAIILDRAHVIRGTGGENGLTFTITTSGHNYNLRIIKFSKTLAHQSYSRRACMLRVADESEDEVNSWVAALNRASFQCNVTIPPPQRKNPFYRLRSHIPNDESQPCMHKYGSVRYLQETDPLLWEINPNHQIAIRKKASLARTKADYSAIISKFTHAFRQIRLPRPRPISLDQTLRDIIPELFLINNIMYGGDKNNLENIFEVLDNFVKKFSSAHEERVRIVSTILQACARTISGGDSYFVVHSLLGNPSMIIRPAEARAMPIEIEVSPTNPCQFVITVSSAFSFHHLEDVEKYEDEKAAQEPLYRIQTKHVQEFDFGTGKSSRWLHIRAADGKKDSNMNDRKDTNGSDSGGYGALLDPLS